MGSTHKAKTRTRKQNMSRADIAEQVSTIDDEEFLDQARKIKNANKKRNRRTKSKKGLGKINQISLQDHERVRKSKKGINADDQEFLLLQVERLMLKGVQNTNRLAKNLEIHHSTAEKYMERVRTRWKYRNMTRQLDQDREHMIEVYNTLEAGLWSRLNNLVKRVDSGEFVSHKVKTDAKEGEVVYIDYIDVTRVEQVIANMYKIIGSYQKHKAELLALTKTNIESKFSEGMTKNPLDLSDTEYQQLEMMKELFIEVARERGLIDDDVELLEPKP